MDILKEMKEKQVAINDMTVAKLFHMLSTLATRGDTETIRRLQDTIFSLRLVKPSANLCSPLITTYMER